MRVSRVKSRGRTRPFGVGCRGRDAGTRQTDDGFPTAKAKEEIYYEPAFDIDYNLKGRFPFQMGKKERKYEAEVVLLFHAGLTIWVDSIGPDFIGPGWNVGLSPGFQFFINSRIGLLAELGWIRTEAFFWTGRFTVQLNQGVFRIGPVFSF